MVNQHFSRATRFLIFDGEGKLLEVRPSHPARTSLDLHQEKHLPGIIEVVADCSMVVASRIGIGAGEELLERGIQPVEDPGTVEAALSRFQKRG